VATLISSASRLTGASEAARPFKSERDVDVILQRFPHLVLKPSSRVNAAQNSLFQCHPRLTSSPLISVISLVTSTLKRASSCSEMAIDTLASIGCSVALIISSKCSHQKLFKEGITYNTNDLSPIFSAKVMLDFIEGRYWILSDQASSINLRTASTRISERRSIPQWIYLTDTPGSMKI